MFDFENTRKQGDFGVAAAIFYFTKEGWAISKPLADSQRYDLIVDDGQKLYRVECKTTRGKTPRGIYTVQLTTCGGNQSWSGKVKKISSSDCDLIFIIAENGNQYLIPSHHLDGRSTYNLGVGANPFLVEGSPI